jgi:hypothetical protein
VALVLCLVSFGSSCLSPHNTKFDEGVIARRVPCTPAEVRRSTPMLHLRHVPGSILWCGVLLLLLPGYASVTRTEGPERVVPPVGDQQRIQEIVDDFVARLRISQKVAVSVVPKNPLMVSVAFDDSDTGFLLSAEEDFVGQLTQEELEAAIAHELGHVWIFTHHPYLQTEALANQIAQRLVPRSSLVQVYEKVWKRQGTKGDLTRFVGD